MQPNEGVEAREGVEVLSTEGEGGPALLSWATGAANDPEGTFTSATVVDLFPEGPENNTLQTVLQWQQTCCHVAV